MKSIVGEFDADKIGQVDYQEFIAFCSSLAGQKRKSSKKKNHPRKDYSDDSDEASESESDYDQRESKKSSKSGRFDKALSAKALKKVAGKVADKFNDLISSGKFNDHEAVFQMIDEKGKGHIRVENMCDVITGDLRVNEDTISKGDLKRLVKQYFDVDSNGRIKYKEFVKFCKVTEKASVDLIQIKKWALIVMTRIRPNTIVVHRAQNW